MRGAPRAATTVALLVLGGAALAGCGDDTGAALDLPRADHQYDGPLHVDEGRYGAAGKVVECRSGSVVGGFSKAEVYEGGATSDSVQEAFDTALSEGMFLELPELDYKVAKTEDDRVLLTYSANGDTKVALVFRNGPATEGAGDDGWYRESWARCDLSEFPEEVAETFYGYQLWTGADGLPALTTEIVSMPGPEHCDWQSMTFLSLGEGQDETFFVRRPIEELRPYAATDFVDDLPLPDDAIATAYSRDGNRLWLSPAGDRVYVGRPGHVEAWPRFETGCA